MKTEFIAQISGEEGSQIGQIDSESGTTTMTVGGVTITAKTRDIQGALNEAAMVERRRRMGQATPDRQGA